MNLQTFTDMTGRIGRQTYWLGLIVLVVISAVLYFILSSVMGTGAAALLANPENLRNPEFMAGYLRAAGWQQVIMLLVLGYPVIALMAKRLNDRDRPSWMKWLFIAPSVVGALLGVAGLAYTMTDAGGGVSMPTPTTLMWIVSMATIVIGLWGLIELGFLRGTIGDNQHGPDPVG